MAGLRKGCDLAFYRCPFRTDYGCEHFNGKDSPCAYGVASRLNKKHLAWAAKDAQANGYSDMAVELHLVYMNKKDWIIEHEKGRTQCLKLETDRKTIAPLRLAGLTKRKHGPRPSLRASEFSKKLHCQRIWSKVDKANFGLEDSRLSIVGRIMHALMNQQHVPYIVENSLLEEIGIRPMPRYDYCEVELFYETEAKGTPVGISGHADSVWRTVPKLLLSVPTEGDVAIFDQKRKAYPMHEEWGHKYQELIYALSVLQQFGLGSEWLNLITAKRPRNAAWNDYRSLQYHITKIKNDESSETVQELRKEISDTYFAQRQLLSSREEFEKNKKRMKGMGECRGCFDRDICKKLHRKSNDSRLPLGELIEDELNAVVGEMILPV